jgi:hypothetical protein
MVASVGVTAPILRQIERHVDLAVQRACRVAARVAKLGRVSAPPSSTRVLRILGPLFACLGGLLWLSAAVLALWLALAGPPALWFLPLVFAGVGAPFALVGAGFLLLSSRRTRARRELVESGRKLVARVVDVEHSLVRINRRRASVLVAEVREPGAQPRQFRSEALLVERDAWLGRSVTVYVDARDPLRYFVELP